MTDLTPRPVNDAIIDMVLGVVQDAHNVQFTGLTWDAIKYRARAKLYARMDELQGVQPEKPIEWTTPAPKPEPYPTPWTIGFYTRLRNPDRSDPTNFGDAPTYYAIYCNGGIAPMLRTESRELADTIVAAVNAQRVAARPHPRPWSVGKDHNASAVVLDARGAQISYGMLPEEAQRICDAANNKLEPVPFAAVHGELELFRAAVRKLRHAQDNYTGERSVHPEWAEAVHRLYKLAGVEA